MLVLKCPFPMPQLLLSHLSYSKAFACTSHNPSLCLACFPLPAVCADDRPQRGQNGGPAAIYYLCIYIYASLFVELVVKNPLYVPGEPFL
jgi:hypothetical protein